MLPRASGDETREREIGLELDLLGLGGLLPPTTTMDAAGGGGHGGGSSAAAQQRSYYEKTTGFDEPLRFAAATETPKLLMLRAPCPSAGGTTPPVATGLIFEGSASASAAAQSTQDVSTAPMTIIYAGAVRAYAGVTLEQAEKILAMVVREAHAAGILAEPRQELVAAGAAQMTTHWRLAHHVNDRRGAQRRQCIALAQRNGSLHK